MPNLRRRRLTIETLDCRRLLAADAAQIGAFCKPYESAALVDQPATKASLTNDKIDGQAVETATAAAKQEKPSYGYNIVGNPIDASPIHTAGLALIGGGSAIDAAFRWLGERAGGGDFVVLSFAKNDLYKTINALSVLDSVESFVIPNDVAANDPFVASRVASAEAIFITGGDQSNYINNWSNTALETAIYTALGSGAALGGTSAGLAVLGDVDYAALFDSTTSAEALANPLASSITLDTQFITPDDAPGTILDYLDETITDSHFMQRDRMGRSLAFMARSDFENKVDNLPRGIAINEQTALLIEANGTARLVGNPYAKKGTAFDQQRSVYMMSTTTPAMLTAGSPLNYQVNVQRLNYDPLTGTSDTFNFNNWSSTNADLYTVTSTAGVLSASVGSVYGPGLA